VKGLKQENGAVAVGTDSCPSTTAKGTFRWSGEFVNPAMEWGYFQATWHEKKSRLHALTIGVYVFVTWSIFDFAIMGPSGTFFLLLAGRLAALGSILMALKFFHSVGGRNGFLVCVLLAQFLIATIAPISLMLGQVEFSIALLSIIIILFAFYVGLPVPLSCNAAICILLSLGFVAVIPTMEGKGFADMLQIVTLLMVANAIGIQMVRTTNILRRDGFLTLKRQQKLNNQLKREVEIRQFSKHILCGTVAARACR